MLTVAIFLDCKDIDIDRYGKLTLLKHLVTFRKTDYEQIHFAEVIFNGELCSQITKDQGG